MNYFSPFALLLAVGSLACFNGCSSDAQKLCEEGAETCSASGSGAFVCKDGAWLSKQACDAQSESCQMAGSVASCVCTEGAVSCSDDSRVVRTCTSGAWVEQTACSEGDVCNFDGDQKAYVCVSEDLACDVGRDRERCRAVIDPSAPNPRYAADAYVCGTNGQWQLKETCQESDICLVRLPTEDESVADPTLKQVAACEPIPCQDGLEYCPAGSVSGNPYVCKNGVLSLKKKCAEGDTCAINPSGQAVCISFYCTPGGLSCAGDGKLYTCNDQRERELVEDCTATGGACRNLHGVSMCIDLCTPDAQQCSAAGNVQVCNADQIWVDSVVCADTQECVVYNGAATCRELTP